MKMNVKKMFGTLTAKFAAMALICGLAGSAWGANTATLTQDGVTTEYQDFGYAYVAIDESKGDAVIKLLADHSYSTRMTFQKAFTLDLNGYTFENSVDKYSGFVAQKNLTIIDTSANQDGLLYSSHCTGAAIVIGTSSGTACTFVMKSGRIQSETAVLDTWDNVTINIEGGSLVSYSRYGAGDSRGLVQELCSGCVLNVTGGEFRSDQSAKSFDLTSFDPFGYPTQKINANSTITVTGGTFSGQKIQRYVPGYTADQSFSDAAPTIAVGDYFVTRSTVTSNCGAAPYDVYVYTVEPAASPAAQNFYQDANDANLWHVANLAGLKEFRDSINNDKVSYANKTIKIDADIDLTNDGYWESIKAYPGSYLSGATIDGDGHTITGMAIVTPDPETGYSYGGGFIDKTAGALTVTNLKFINATVTAPSGSQVGVVVGMTYGNVTLNNVDLENCSVTGITKTGAFVGQNDEGTVALTDCDLVNTKVYANYSAALMIGLLNTNSKGSQFTNCTADGNSEFVWTADATNGFGTKGDVVINGRTYSISGSSLWLTDPGTDCWSERRVDNASYTYDGVTYSLKGSVFYPNNVAQIGGTKYETLAEAFTAAQDGDTVVLLQDVALDTYVRAKDKEITLDLNGKTVSGSAVATLLVDGAQLTIDDTSASGEGQVLSTSENTSYGVVFVQNAGSIIVNAGTIASDFAARAAIRNVNGNGCAITVNGGNVKNTAGKYAILAHGDADVTITGGAISAPSWTIINYGTGDIEISGGSVSTTSGNGVIENNAAANVTVSGTAVLTSASQYVIINKSTGVVSISGGTLSANYFTIDNRSTGSVEISGGEVSAIQSAIYNRDAGPVEISGGTVSATTSFAVNNRSVGSVAISNGVISAAGEIAVINFGNGTVTISGGRLSANEDAVYNGEYGTSESNPPTTGVVNILGGTIRAEHQRAIANHTGTVNISGGEISALKNVIMNFNPGGAVTVSGDAEITADDDSEGNGCAIYIPSGGADSFDITGGKISGIIQFGSGTYSISGGLYSLEPNSGYLADGKAIASNSDGATKDAYPYVVGTVVVGTLTPQAESETSATYSVPVSLETEEGDVIASLGDALTVSVSVAEGDIADTTLSDIKVDSVVGSAVAAAGGTADSIVVEIAVSTNDMVVGESSVSYEVKPEAVVTVTKDEATTTTTNELTNADLASGASFTFDLDVTATGVAVGDWVKVTHVSSDYPTETNLYKAKAGANSTIVVTVTTTHFSTFTAEPADTSGEDAALIPSVTNTVASANCFGSIAISSVATNYAFVAVPFGGFSATGDIQIAAADIVQASALTAGDRMYVWNGSGASADVQKYEVYTVSASGTWEVEDKKVTVAADGTVSTGSESPEALRVASGTGVFIERQDKTKPIYVYGQVLTNTVAETVFESGLTLVSPPSVKAMGDINLNALSWSGVSPATLVTLGDTKIIGSKKDADFIYFRNAANKVVRFYYDGSKWGTAVGAWDDTNAVIPAGTAFWYMNNGSAAVTW